MRDKSEFVDVELETGLAVRFLYLGNDRLAREYAEWDFEEESNPELYAFDQQVAFIIEADETIAIGDRIGDYEPIAKFISIGIDLSAHFTWAEPDYWTVDVCSFIINHEDYVRHFIDRDAGEEFFDEFWESLVIDQVTPEWSDEKLQDIYGKGK
tara:strand:- start:857 stop:1318 length:462 start_codon:yes stop_codon:yes gene_type:complete